MRAFSHHIERRTGWVRLFGSGITWKHIPAHPLLFSERHGYKKGLTIGKWYFRILKGNNDF